MSSRASRSSSGSRSGVRAPRSSVQRSSSSGARPSGGARQIGEALQPRRRRLGHARLRASDRTAAHPLAHRARPQPDWSGSIGRRPGASASRAARSGRGRGRRLVGRDRLGDEQQIHQTLAGAGGSSPERFSSSDRVGSASSSSITARSPFSSSKRAKSTLGARASAPCPRADHGVDDLVARSRGAALRDQRVRIDAPVQAIFGAAEQVATRRTHRALRGGRTAAACLRAGSWRAPSRDPPRPAFQEQDAILSPIVFVHDVRPDRQRAGERFLLKVYQQMRQRRLRRAFRSRRAHRPCLGLRLKASRGGTQIMFRTAVYKLIRARPERP